MPSARSLTSSPQFLVHQAPVGHLPDILHDGDRLQRPAVPHDLRNVFASDAVMGGESPPMLGRILGDTQAQTTSRYAHLADDPLRKASERVASSHR